MTRTHPSRTAPPASHLLALALSSCAVLAASTGCQDEEPPSAVDVLLDAAGLPTTGTDLPVLYTSSQVEWYEILEGSSPGEPPVLTDRVEQQRWLDVAQDRLRIERVHEHVEPLVGSNSHADILVGEDGVIDGIDTLPVPLPRRTMGPARRAFTAKFARYAVPWLYARRAQLDPTTVQMTQESGSTVLEVDEVPRPVRLYVEPSSGDISRLTTMEYDFLLGDVAIEVVYDDWQTIPGTSARLPYRVDIMVDNMVVYHEQRTDAVLDPASDPERFGLPAVDPASDLPLPTDIAAEHELGHAVAHWIGRLLGIGVPIIADLPQASVIAIPLTPDVAVLAGPTHHSMAVDIGDSIVVVEPPVNESRSQALIAEVAVLWPGKPISHIVCSHHHFDHCGGVRTFAAVGATVVIGEASADFMAEVLERPHTVIEDELARVGGPTDILTVGTEPLILGAGDQRLELWPLASVHADDMLLAFAPAAGALFNADLYNTGSSPAPGDAVTNSSATFAEVCDAIADFQLPVTSLVGGHAVTEPVVPESVLAQALGRPSCLAP